MCACSCAVSGSGAGLAPDLGRLCAAEEHEREERRGPTRAPVQPFPGALAPRGAVCGHHATVRPAVDAQARQLLAVGQQLHGFIACEFADVMDVLAALVAESR